MKETNPLLVEAVNPYNAPAFDKIGLEDYRPAFEYAIETGKKRVREIVNRDEKPDFFNTIEALEFAGRELSAISAIFFNLNEANTNEAMQQTAIELSPLLTEYSNDIILNEELFQKIKEVYRQKDEFGLNREQARLLDETYKRFVRNGANLPVAKRDEYRNIQTELAKLTLQFSQNLLGATNSYLLHLTNESQLDGLPQFVIDMGRADAMERGVEGWVYTLHAPSYNALLKYSNVRELRIQLWMAGNTKCMEGIYDNRGIVKRIVELRLKNAELLGYSTHAGYVLEESMAKSPEAVSNFLSDLLDKMYPCAKKDISEIEEYAAKRGFTDEFMPWDFSYWSEKYRDEKYALNDELLKPYFELSNVEDAVLGLATRLYGLHFSPEPDLPIYHPDVKVYKVSDNDGRYLSLLYLDYFPRESKSGGAWMTTFREQQVYKGNEMRPFVSIVCNFTKPTESTPSLLTFHEVTTLLHEFGHALHGMLAEGSYPSLTGTNVVRDFVELPSQIMENWATESEYLKSFAHDYRTGEPIPDSTIEKIVASRNYLSGYANVRQLSFGINDMAWHTLTEVPQNIDIENFEKEAVESTRMFPLIEHTCFSTSFSHIFAGGYSAGYYSYKWAELLEADAFSLFKERGIFDKAVATSFREHILSKGNLIDADELYRIFRGRNPKADALLEKFGMNSCK